MPQKWVEADGFKLGQWAQVQRTEHGKGRISLELATRLEGISGWVWDPYAADFEEGFAHLERYVAEHGDARMRQDFIDTDGFRLGQWVGARRLAHAKGKLDPMRTARLEALPGWVWDSRQLRSSTRATTRWSPSSSARDICGCRVVPRGGRHETRHVDQQRQA